MANRVIDPVKLLTAGSMTGTSTISSNAMDIMHFGIAALQAVWTGTPNGTFSIQGSIDNLNFDDLGISVNAASGSADNRLINLSGVGFRYLKLSYTNTSGTGSLTVWGMAKEK